MDLTRKISFLVFILCVLISLKNQNAETNKGSQVGSGFSPDEHFTGTENKDTENLRFLEYDYYSESCPQAERIIRSTVQELYNLHPSVVPALIRLVFHDCFVEGCDASILLDTADGIDSEKDSPPNNSLKGFDLIDIVKSNIEEACPGVVSCADIIVMAARESVILAGGPFYPLATGRRDNTISFSEIATLELPSPQDDLSTIIQSFASRGFDARETVSLLGAHSIGTIHCKFFHSRLYNFNGTDEPDPSLDTEFLNFLRSKCNKSKKILSPEPSPSLSPSSARQDLPSSSSKEPGIKMDLKEAGSVFGTLFYQNLLQSRGILFVDQQLMASEETETWVSEYASNIPLFRRDFALSMMKLSNVQVLTAPMGQVRRNCRKVD